ncbi:MAG: 4-hydroxy-tetrahydrodipicolinate synthase [Bacillota bacterium]|nr:4-hydroxy-tetrahydrodipicolinate synthase [Bacillota bacterium]
MEKRVQAWGRVLTAMVTPFDERLQVNYDQAAKLAEKLVRTGSDGLVVAGTTGESPTLTKEEKLKLFAVVAEAVGGQGTVLANVGTNNTEASVEMAKAAEKTGVDGLMAVVPYYNKPSQEGLYRHFRAIAEATQLPIMIYNIPGRTGVNLLPETMARLAELPNVVAIKEASGDLNQISEVCRLLPPRVQVYSGDDALTLPVLAVGGVGVVSVASHLVGGQIKEMIEFFFQGKVKEAAAIHQRLLPLFRVLFITTNPVPVKTALNQLGLPVGGVRPPLWEAEPKQVEAVRNELRRCGLLA